VTTSPPQLQAVDLGKTFGALTALDGVSLTLRPGTVHALLGENGAGKSTLVKCILGYHRPDRGRLLLDGNPVAIRSPRDAQTLGIGMVYQHFTVVPNMTVMENLVLARARLPFFIDWEKSRAELQAFFERVPFRLPLDAPVRSLSAGERQKLEILKQLYLRNQIIILDEPTSVLTPSEADEALGLLREMARRAEISVLLITHKFREVTAFTDEVTVLRRGRFAGRGMVSELTTSRMAEMMMGAPAEGSPLSNPVFASRPPGQPRLRIDQLSAADDLGLPALRQVSFDVRSGEIVGIAGVAGNGQEELVEVLGGQRPRTGGEVFVHGRTYEPTRKEMRDHAVRCLPEEPLRNACVGTMSVAENVGFRRFDVPPFVRARWGLRRGALREHTRRLVEAYRVRMPSLDAPISALSGGNVQRAVLARELDGDVEVLIVANPCMGLDFGAVAEIHARLRSARDRGTAVLLISADLDEVLALSDRVLVISEGRITHETRAGSADVAVIGRHMAGHESAA
jgi:general nucleoside transport system ATP-binding protein